jgi:hypothetical protein
MFPTSLLLHKLILSNTLAHRTRATNTSAHHLQQLIRIVRAAPLLVRNNLNALLHLRFLHNLAVSPHAPVGESGRERVGDESGRVQARERDELPAVAHGREARDVGFLVFGLHGRFPVEGGGEVVGESKVEN